MNIGQRLTEAISVKPRTGQGNAGDPTYGAIVPMTARIERRTGEVLLGDGRFLNYSHVIYASAQIKTGDVVYFSGDDTTSANAGKTATEDQSSKTLDGQSPGFWVAYI